MHANNTGACISRTALVLAFVQTGRLGAPVPLCGPSQSPAGNQAGQLVDLDPATHTAEVKDYVLGLLRYHRGSFDRETMAALLLAALKPGTVSGYVTDARKFEEFSGAPLGA